MFLKMEKIRPRLLQKTIKIKKKIKTFKYNIIQYLLHCVSTAQPTKYKHIITPQSILLKSYWSRNS